MIFFFLKSHSVSAYYVTMSNRQIFGIKSYAFFIITVFTRVSAAMLFKLFTPQVRRLLEGGVYLKVGCDKEINHGIIFRNKLTELLSFGSDFIKAAALI